MTVGRPFQVGLVPQIEAGETTAAQLERLFGPPVRTGLDDGVTTATWLHYKVRLIGETHTRDLYVKFDDDGTVLSYTFNSSFPGDAAELHEAESEKK